MIIRPKKQSIFKVSNLNGIKYLTCSHVKFSDLCEHKFRHNFYVTPMCLHSEDTETNEHYLLCCQLHADCCGILFDTVPNIIQNDVSTFHENMTNAHFFYTVTSVEVLNHSTLESTVKFIHDSGHFTRYVRLSM